jgi:Alpha-mannosidase
VLIEQQFQKVLAKTKTMENTYSKYIFRKTGSVDTLLYETENHYRNLPANVSYRPIKPGDVWGGEHITGWFQGKVLIDESSAGKRLFLSAQTGARESLLFLNGVPSGIYANKILVNSVGNHSSLQLTRGEAAGTAITFAVESYCWHNIEGTMPFEERETSDRKAVYQGVFIEEMREEVKDFVIELKILNQLSEHLPDDFRRAQVRNCLLQVYNAVPQKPAECDEETWTAGIGKARLLMKPVLESANPASAPTAGLIGHSHMDTAWLWTVDETIRKCARTYSNALSLMDQYPEYKFFQSSAYHSELMRREYPPLFEKMKARVRDGRYEPNGGVWVECDCNLVSGESLVRQFLWGQRWLKQNFGYRSNTFWLPDTFGYSGALPQVMQGCGIQNFLTTKMSWNDTNVFPYDTFYWRGIDGSEVLTHFNASHCYPDPATLIDEITGTPNRPDGYQRSVRHKMVNDCRLLSYGYGDGGGGPSYDMIETALRLKDVEGCPKASHTTVRDFMKKLRSGYGDIPVYAGELYLELHRGTLTGKHDIKRNNRKAEIALHDLDFAAAAARTVGEPCPPYRDLTETLLVNQFHDILPGTCIPEVNERVIGEVGNVVREYRRIFDGVMSPSGDRDCVSLVNTLSWDRGSACLPFYGAQPVGSNAQTIRNVRDEKMLYVEGIHIPAYASVRFKNEPVKEDRPSPFRYDGVRLDTPQLAVTFDGQGAIVSLVDKTSGRELRKEGGYPLNTFLMGEDVPLIYDNWDIDMDALAKMRPAASLIRREVTVDGALQFRLRSTYSLGKSSEITQDMIFYASTPRIDFETLVDWKETHQLLKTAFDLDITADTARHEIQFGYAERPTFKRNSYEQAMFEVLNHKYTDISETRFGVAILNDCKYGISIDGTQAALSLIKSGTHPDPGADKGLHLMTYSILPHGEFSAQNVVRPAYELNVPIRFLEGPSIRPDTPLLSVSAPNVIAETVKVAEDGDGIIVRLYECEKSGCDTNVSFNFPHHKVYLTNMLEEIEREIDEKEKIRFRAFEIKTLKIM